MRRALACLLLSGSATVTAQTLQLDPLIVSGDAEPAPPSSTQLDGSAAETSDALSLDTWLQQVPGVFAQNRYNLAQGLRPSIRGFGARAAFGVRGIQVLVDGVPLTLPDGQTELDVLDLEAVERIDVIRGPAAALFGNAAGGVIAIETADPPESFETGARITAGELGLRRWRATLGGGLGADTSARLALGEQRLDGARDHANSQVRRLNARSRTGLANGRVKFNASALDVTAQDPGSLTRAQVDDDPGQAAANNLRFDAGERIRQQRLSGRWLRTTRTASWSLQGFAGQRLFENRLPFESGGQVSFDRRFGGLGGTLTTTTAGWDLTTGLDLQHQRDARRRYDNLDGGVRGDLALDQTETATGSGLYLAAERPLGPGWQLDLGLRLDHLRIAVDDHFGSDGDDSGDRDFDATSWSAQLARELGADHRLTLRVASAFESPTATELANPDGGGFNPDLDPARATAAELGVSGLTPSASYSIVVFTTRLRDELVPFERDDQPGRTFYRNSGRSSRDGVELAWTQQLTPRWSTHAGYTFSQFEFDDYMRDGMDFAGNRQPGIPRQHGYLTVSWAPGATLLSLRGRFIGELYADDANSTRVPGHALLDLGGSLPLDAKRRWTLRAGVNNLGDIDYADNVRINAFGGRYFEPAPGRHVYAGLEAAF
ncbi:TonB-dependent receptor [uncultured Abyssibacter sp.]|uniref:TonB-dependent receptor family protein n=1 Tax=uncultured Abyssibacter sp. TaxID=2320202 RepID=UPI0032B256D8